MNQDNNFKFQGNNEMSNNQQLNNQSYNQNMNVNESKQPKTNNNIKSAFTTSIISFVLFVIVALIFIFFCYLNYKDNSGMSGLFIIIAFILALFPFLVSVILSIISFFSYKKCNVFELKRKHKTFKILNILQIPIILIILFVGLNAKDNNRNNMVDEKLSSLYNNNYEVIKTCSHSDTGGSNYEIVALKLKNFEIPIIAEFDWARDDYNDNYDELKEMSALDYKSYINNVFNGKTVSLMEVSRNDKYDLKHIYLNILITENQIIDSETLKNNIEEIAKKYFSMYPDYDFFFDLDVVNKIDENKMEEYYLFLSEGKQNCNGELNDNLQLSREIGISFLLDNNSNIESVIDNDINSFFNGNR